VNKNRPMVMQTVSVTKINWLMSLREIIAVYAEKHVKPVNILWAKRRAANC
jgi:hypothetical protein